MNEKKKNYHTYSYLPTSLILIPSYLPREEGTDDPT